MYSQIKLPSKYLIMVISENSLSFSCQTSKNLLTQIFSLISQLEMNKPI
jgi:hypothetical protein